MRRPDQIVHSRARVTSRYALMPMEGFPPSRLPGWGDAEVFVLASPRLGAEFVEYVVDLPASSTGRAERKQGVETFYYVLSGRGRVNGTANELTTGSFGLVPPDAEAPSFVAADSGTMRLLILHKRYESAPDHAAAVGCTGHVDDVAAEVWADNPSSRLQALIPDDPAFDMAMNIFTFDPGCGLPIVETHVMEHGLMFLEGRGLYYLDGEWMEAEQGDFIWMAPYCPQSYVAAGPTPTKYLYYKNVNREVPL
ncbi:MAG: (S)-ureidoglycine aminohydrolase [Planctomycetota bacterium]